MDDTGLTLATPAEVAKALARRATALRLGRQWMQSTLASRAGVTLASYRRFENTGKASLQLVLKVAHALARLDEFEKLLEPPAARSIQDLERQTEKPRRQRGRL